MHVRSHWNRLFAGLGRTARLNAAALAGLTLAVGLPAGAVVIDSIDGSANTCLPTPAEPLCAWVGTINGKSGVYLRNGWVLTANHVGTGTFWLGGVPYDYIGTKERIQNPDLSFADLQVIGLWQDPGLAELPIRSSGSIPNGKVIMIGGGLNRLAATDSDDPDAWDPPPAPPGTPIPGWFVGAGRTLRWGENEVEGVWPGNPANTFSLYTVFDYPSVVPGHQEHEAQSAPGDSGGAVFAKQGNTWELAGIMTVVGPHEGQASLTVLRDNLTGMANLSVYRDEILTLTTVPEPSGALMLGAGSAFLVAIGRRRIRP